MRSRGAEVRFSRIGTAGEICYVTGALIAAPDGDTMNADMPAKLCRNDFHASH